ncbi:hypothetical protein MKZ38_007417 [Zalerion maritima]|uniref:Uncharacterized protein n=1 Tax=Zalerion maritima TaxID=339359 RepID=A0AAD5RWS0_9PEZI|nr:hypothetical protein MKZ38_007417 [Zalerion maritima]
MHHPMPVPKLHPHINVISVFRDQATLWVLSGIVFTTSGVFIGLALRGGQTGANAPKGPGSQTSSSHLAPFENVGFTATVANSLFSLIHLYCSTVPVLRDRATGLLEVRHVYFFVAVLTGFVCCIGSAASFLFNWKISLLLGYASATCGAVAAGQLAGAINPGVVVCRGGGVHTGGFALGIGVGGGGASGYGHTGGGGGGGMPTRVGHHYVVPACEHGHLGGHGHGHGTTSGNSGQSGRSEFRCVCGGTLTTVAGTMTHCSGSGNSQSRGTGTEVMGMEHQPLRSHISNQTPPPEAQQRSHTETVDRTNEKQLGEPLAPVQSQTGTVKLHKETHHLSPRKHTPTPSLRVEPCYEDACPGRLSSDGAAACVDMSMGLTGVGIV